ncbi:MAG: amidohydrolase, partial [Chitinophagia bacterium]|nr:amidohydrolase [Chitinophagia bacterium]
GCIAVQADQTEAETQILIREASQHSFIKGVIGWVDLNSTEIEAALDSYTDTKILKGFRHILQAEPKGFMLAPSFKKGIDALAKYNYTYDLLIYESQLKEAKEFISNHKEQPIVIDHLAKPNIKEGEWESWKKNITKIAQHPNVYCKISGMATEAHWYSWTMDTLKPYIDTVVETFGTDRIMFGSDWPVCLLASSYSKWLETLQNYFNTFSIDEQSSFFANNAIKFYKI